MRKWVLVCCCVLYGCGATPEEEVVAPTEKEPVTQVPVEEKSLYPTVGSYFEVIEFQDGIKPEGKPNQNLYYDAGAGIASVNIASFYRKYRESEERLDSKRMELAKAEYFPAVRPSADKDPVYEFLQKNLQRETDPDTYSIPEHARSNLELLNFYKSQKLKDLTLQQLEEFIILAEENGDYLLVQKIYKFKCKKFKKSCQIVELQLSGWVKDDALKPLENVTIEILNDPSLGSFTTDASGNYAFSLDVRPYQLVRLRFLREEYMPHIKEIRVGSAKSVYQNRFEIRMPKAHQLFETELDLKKGDKPYRIQTGSGTIFGFPPGSVQKMNGKPYRGEIKIYTYDFNPWYHDMGSVLAGALRLEGGVVPGVSMRSYGMPYVQVVGASGELLRISKQNPATVTSTSQSPRSVYKTYGSDFLDEARFWKHWIKYSKENGPFTSADTQAKQISYWSYNLETGIWDEVPLEITDVGTFKSVFYTHN